MRKDGTIEIVADMIKCLKMCDPKTKIEILIDNTHISIVHEPNKRTTYIHIDIGAINRKCGGLRSVEKN